MHTSNGVQLLPILPATSSLRKNGIRRAITIKEADPKVQRRIAGLASKLMDKLTKGGSTDAIERDIDSEFYSLYALSAAETRCPGEISRLFGGRLGVIRAKGVPDRLGQSGG